MCHLWADTEEELHAMADRIGVARRWHQRPPKASWSHYDISLGKKALAIARGAVLTDMFGPVEHVARLDLASGDPERMARGHRKIEGVARIRARRAEENVNA
jgi:hypothetical protein